MAVKCDGCDGTDVAKFFKARGHVMRYCDACADHYTQFESAYNAEAKRLSRMLELWAEDARQKVPLNLTPVDLPELVMDMEGNAVLMDQTTLG
jgi:hypothetical protein